MTLVDQMMLLELNIGRNNARKDYRRDGFPTAQLKQLEVNARDPYTGTISISECDFLITQARNSSFLMRALMLSLNLTTK
mmetsp:Transcript_6325/g.12606  ORF Transcript_6325/g.12606 Transcript_6325/m.12606 type:complete len:80 (-) Transcript_6325:39-278(-)